jgi:TPR repeat protein
MKWAAVALIFCLLPLTCPGQNGRFAVAHEMIKVDADNPDAWTVLGECYLQGDGCPQNFAKAAECFQNGARGANQLAQLKLAHMYEFGRGVPTNPTLATTIKLKLANEGNLLAQFDLGGEFQLKAVRGTLYGEYDAYAVHSYKWYSLAAGTNWQLKGESLIGRNQVAREMSGASLARAQTLVGEFKIAPPTPWPTNQTVPKLSATNDATKIVLYQLQRATDGSAQAQYDVGMRFLRGDGVGTNAEVARWWLEKAASQSNNQAIGQLKKLREQTK